MVLTPTMAMFLMRLVVEDMGGEVEGVVRRKVKFIGRDIATMFERRTMGLCVASGR